MQVLPIPAHTLHHIAVGNGLQVSQLFYKFSIIGFCNGATFHCAMLPIASSQTPLDVLVAHDSVLKLRT